MAIKTVSFTLDVGSIDAAIKQVKHHQNEIIRLMGMLVRVLVQQGQQIARLTIIGYDAVDTTNLLNNTGGYYNDRNHVGVIYSNTWYAFYVEYGTGVPGENSPHPEIDETWMPPPIHYTSRSGVERVYTQYDTYGHGESGWVYPKGEDQFVHTYGMPARPFMYDTFRRLEAEAKKVALDIFNTEWR